MNHLCALIIDHISTLSNSTLYIKIFVLIYYVANHGSVVLEKRFWNIISSDMTLTSNFQTFPNEVF